MDFKVASFIASAHTPSQWLPDFGAEVAFAGRSNVGKSSAINTITAHNGLARTSKTPGRTQQIVFFALTESRRLVDLPGYGFANVPLKLRKHWGETIEQYLSTRESLRGLVVPMDIRRPLMPLDQQLVGWCQDAGLNYHILLTKADKLSKSKANQALDKLKRDLADCEYMSVQLFSAPNKTGVDQARGVIARWLK